MDKLDWSALLRRVDEGFCSWRQPSLLLFGTSGQCRGCSHWVLSSAAVRGRGVREATPQFEQPACLVIGMNESCLWLIARP